MASYASAKARSSYALDLSTSGHRVLCHRDAESQCLNCGKDRWLVGRMTFECTACGTQVPNCESDHARFDTRARKFVALHVVHPQGGDTKAMDDRTEVREAASGRVLSLILDGSPHAFSLRNISSGGAMGNAIPGVAEAESIMVELEDGTLIPAELKWSDSAHLGIAFIEPVRRGLMGLFRGKAAPAH